MKFPQRIPNTSKDEKTFSAPQCEQNIRTVILEMIYSELYKLINIKIIQIKVIKLEKEQYLKNKSTITSISLVCSCPTFVLKIKIKYFICEI